MTHSVRVLNAGLSGLLCFRALSQNKAQLCWRYDWEAFSLWSLSYPHPLLSRSASLSLVGLGSNPRPAESQQALATDQSPSPLDFSKTLGETLQLSVEEFCGPFARFINVFVILSLNTSVYTISIYITIMYIYGKI